MSNEPLPDDISDKVSAAFKNGTVFEASNTDLDQYLRWTASEPIPNELIRHAQIIRASTINTIKTDRYIKKANRQNTFLTWIIVVLTIVTLFVSFFSIYLTTKQTSDSETQMRELIKLQKQQVELLNQQPKRVEKLRQQSTPATAPVRSHTDKEH